MPPDKAERRPDQGPPLTKETVNSAHVTDIRPHLARRHGAEFLAAYRAESIVCLELQAITALRMLTTEQLRAIVWVGLLDDGWGRVFAELEERGESL